MFRYINGFKNGHKKIKKKLTKKIQEANVSLFQITLEIKYGKDVFQIKVNQD